MEKYNKKELDNIAYNLYVKSFKENFYDIITKETFVFFKNLIYQKYYDESSLILRRQKIEKIRNGIK